MTKLQITKLQKLIYFIGLMALIAALAGCEFLDNLRASILQKGGETIDTAVKKAGEVKEQVKKTKESVEKKVKEVQDAVNEVKEAADEVQEALDAVKKVTGGVEDSGTTTK